MQLPQNVWNFRLWRTFTYINRFFSPVNKEIFLYGLHPKKISAEHSVNINTFVKELLTILYSIINKTCLFFQEQSSSI